jgi:tetratricopeptide (TPR) repeat protein
MSPKILFIITLPLFINYGNTATGQINSGNTKLDSLRQELQNATDANNRFNILFNGLFIELIEKNNEAALEVATQANNLAINLQDSLGIVRSGRGKGYALSKLGRNEDALRVFQNVLEIAKQNKFTSLETSLLNNIALVYTQQASYDKALDYHFRSLTLREETNDRGSIAITQNNIGLIYYKLNDFENALKYYLQSLSLKKEIKDMYDIERSYINIGLCYVQFKKFEKAMHYIDTALSLCGSGCSDVIQMEIHAARGFTMREMGNIASSYSEFEKSLALALQVKNILFETECYYNLGLLQMNDGIHLNQSIQYLKKAEGILLLTTHYELRPYIRLNKLN